jgi:apolipoprotein N-acyltransferase
MNRPTLSRAVRIVLAVLAGILFHFALRLTPWWPAAWLAPIPLLVAAFHAGGSEARLLAWLAAAIGLSSNFTYYLTTAGPPAAVVVMLLQMLLWGYLVGRARAAVLARPAWPAIFVFPVLLAAFATLIARISPHGTWGSYAYTQMDAVPVIQIASVLGAPAIEFLVALFASTAAVAIYRGRQMERPWLAYGLPVVLLAAGLGFGELRLRRAGIEPTVKVGVASIDDFIGGRVPADHAEAVWRGYDETVARLAARGARIVVLPEKIGALSEDEAARRQAHLASLARGAGVYLMVGVQLNHPHQKDNVAWLFSPAGELLAEYHKQHMVPHLEGDLTPGNEEMVRQIDGTPFGLAICRDMIFTSFGRSYGLLGVPAMLAPAWDFYRDAWMASNVAALRGVENGYAVVRAGRESYLNVSDRYGRTVARRRSDFLPGSSLLADLPIGPAAPTFYARHGDIFGWLMVAASIWLVFVQPAMAKRSRAAYREAQK